MAYAEKVHNSSGEPPSVLALPYGEDTDLKERAVWLETTKEETKHVPEYLRENTPDKLADVIATGDFKKDSRDWEEVLEDNLKELSDKLGKQISWRCYSSIKACGRVIFVK